MRCLKELLETEEYVSIQDKLSIFALTHSKSNKFKAYKYTFEGLKDAIETETEIR